MSRPKAQTQFIVFNLYGDYVNPRGDSVWTSGLIDVLHVLGVGERAARSTLSRMKQKGWLRAQKDGRRSAYQLTPRGKHLLDEGRRRLFGPRQTQWDERWHLVIYSLPQEMRAARHQLRTGLTWLGYGMLSPGTMIAAYPMKAEVQALIDELGVADYVDFFTDSKLEMARHKEIVARCWDLPSLNDRYARFIERNRSAFDQLILNGSNGDGLSRDESFERRFWTMYEYSSFPREDPQLPKKLLPKGWRGIEAAELLNEVRATLKEPAEEFIDSTLGIHTRRKSNGAARQRSA